LAFGLLAFLMWCGASVLAADSEAADILRRSEQALKEAQARRDNPLAARPHYQQAAGEYARLGDLGIQNPDLLRNEGNAFLLTGDLPRAIFAYRRGLRLAPGDSALQTNLRFAREEVDYPSGEGFGRPRVDDWPPWLPRPTLSALLFLTVVGYTAGLLALTRWWMKRQTFVLIVGAALLVLAVAPLSGALHEAWRQRQEANARLVVVAANRVALRNGDGVAYPARYDGKTVNRGVEARLLFERGDWLHIELSGGETGWVPRSAVLLDTGEPG
jgi:tetratricopeptide (TPR) repeat protein